ncbi:MAG: Ldh family oxidoreductase, partial [Herpetosiphonaceae bacterium]|nr:Ldh family oxidoreductase [Herpetosiphonaceae bacterium]
GQIIPVAQPVVTARTGAVAHIDAARGWGQVAAHLATETVLAIAQEQGLGAVVIDRCNHIGRLGEYAERIAQADMIGIAVCNAESIVAPFGGRGAIFGTNPLAIAAPRGADEAPLLVDFATAGIAEGKVRVAAAKGEQIGPGLVLDRAGQPSQDPQALYDGGVLLPFGGHKGYGLSLMIELLGGALSGMAPSALPAYHGGNGTLFLALNITAFTPLAQFRGQAEQLCAAITASPPAAGYAEVLLPGEPEQRAHALRTREGISVADQTWHALEALATELAVVLPAST